MLLKCKHSNTCSPKNTRCWHEEFATSSHCLGRIILKMILMSWIYLFLLKVLKVKYCMSYRNPNGFDCNQAMSSFESVGGLEFAIWKWYSTEFTPLLSKWDHQFLVLANTFFASYSGEVKDFSIFLSENGTVVNFLPIYPIKSL